MASEQALEFKGATLQIIHTLLRTADPAVLGEALRALTGDATDFFSGEPAILDFSQAAELPAAIDWPAIVGLFRAYQLKPAGIRGAAGDLLATAEAAGLVAIGDSAFGRPGRSPPPAAAAAPAVVEVAPQVPSATPAAPPTRTLVIDKPLRSGQRVYARGADLVVLAMVSAGAEVIADGNIHVYAPLRGRALAGAAGDQEAQVFTTCLQAELVSIAGIYRTFDQGLPPKLVGQPAKIGLSDDGGELTLRIEPLPIR